MKALTRPQWHVLDARVARRISRILKFAAEVWAGLRSEGRANAGGFVQALGLGSVGVVVLWRDEERGMQ